MSVSGGITFIVFQLDDVIDPKYDKVLEMGCNYMCEKIIGNLKYHKEVYNKYPHGVAQFTCLDDLDGQKGFGIGEINGRGGTRVTQIISYNTPYKKGGKKVLITLGQGKCRVKTLFS